MTQRLAADTFLRLDLSVRPSRHPVPLSMPRPPILPGVVLLGVLSLLVGCSRDRDAGPAKTPFVLAIQPTSTPEKLSARSAELEAFLEARMEGVDVKIHVPTLYAGTIEALRFGHADAAFVGAWPARIAVDRAGARVVLGEIREVFAHGERLEAPSYSSYWIVKPDSAIQTLADLRGKKVAFPSRLSTSGYVFPMARLVADNLIEAGADGVDPSAYFGEVLYAGGYAQGLEALEKGQVDATLIAGDVPQALYDKALQSMRVIAEQSSIPSHAVVVGGHVDAELAARFEKALLELGDEAHRPLMRAFVSGIFLRFVETDAETHLAGLRGALDSTRLGFTETLR